MAVSRFSRPLWAFFVNWIAWHRLETFTSLLHNTAVSWHSTIISRQCLHTASTLSVLAVCHSRHTDSLHNATNCGSTTNKCTAHVMQ